MPVVATRGGDLAVQARDVTLGNLITASGGSLRGAAGPAVNDRQVAGLPAWQQAIRVAAWSIAQYEMCVWRGRDTSRRRVTTTWQARFFAGQPDYRDPSLSWFYLWECLEASLTARNNGVLRMWPAGGQTVEAFEVIHPDNVAAKWDAAAGQPSYKVLEQDGRWSDPIGPWDILHFRVGSVLPGAVWAPSPIELHRQALGSVLARNQAETAVYGSGAMRSVAVVFPGEVTPEQAQEFKDVYLGPGGVTGDERVKVFGGNPRVETIGLSLADSQYVESQAFSVYDIGRILGVMPSLLWGAVANGDRPLTPEHEEDRWRRYGLNPRRMRIDQTIGAHPRLFGQGSRDHPGFAFDPVASDSKTESENLVREVQSGILLPDEARARRGLPPLPDGIGQIPQITPVGGAPNQVPVAPAAAQPVEEQAAHTNTAAVDELAATLGRIVKDLTNERTLRAAAEARHYELLRDLVVSSDTHERKMMEADAARAEREIETRSALIAGLTEAQNRQIDALEQLGITVNVEPTPVHIHVPETPAPVVNIAAADMPAPVVNVDVQVPEQTPPTVVVNVPDPAARKVEFERNQMGMITSATVTDD